MPGLRIQLRVAAVKIRRLGALVKWTAAAGAGLWGRRRASLVWLSFTAGPTLLGRRAQYQSRPSLWGPLAELLCLGDLPRAVPDEPAAGRADIGAGVSLMRCGLRSSLSLATLRPQRRHAGGPGRWRIPGDRRRLVPEREEQGRAASSGGLAPGLGAPRSCQAPGPCWSRPRGGPGS